MARLYPTPASKAASNREWIDHHSAAILYIWLNHRRDAPWRVSTLASMAVSKLGGQKNYTMALFKKKYRIEPARLKDHDYSAEGSYYITICTKDRRHHFGAISSSTMSLTKIGQIAHECWAAIPDHFPSAVIDAFVIMPNHVHGILSLTVAGAENADPGRAFGPLKPGSIPSIVNAFKASVTRISRKEGFVDFAWQDRYYDHVIRGDIAMERIRAYINNNVAQWDTDEHNRP